MKKPELLLPAGTPEALETALLYGADAVYAGMPSLSLRAQSGFSEEELAAGIASVRRQKRKIYLTLNMFSRNADAERLGEFAETVARLRPDGLIVSDPGVFMFMKEHAPEIPLHISTQANVGSWLTVDFWRRMGAAMCVLSRETPFADIEEIRRRCPGIRLEMFVHGAMCMSYSGRCLLSSFMAGRSANRGQCAHACRWEYRIYLEEAKRPGELMPLEEDGRGSYIMNSRDLCLMPKLDRILAAGIDCLKIEGRNKTPYYVAQTARVYRQAIDDWFGHPETWAPEPYMAELETLQNRGYTLGFFDGVISPEQQNYETTQSTGTARNAGAVREWTDKGALVTLYHRLAAGDILSFLPPFRRGTVDVELPYVIDAFSGERKEALSPGRPGQAILLPHSLFGAAGPAELPVRTVARIRRKEPKK